MGEPKSFEVALEETGGFGVFQVLILVGLLLPEIPASFVAFSQVLVGRAPLVWYFQHGNESRILDQEELCNYFENDPENVYSTDSSIVAEWKLICGNEWVSDFITSLQMFGMLLGSIFSSQLSDAYGRRRMYLSVCLVMFGGQLASAFATNSLHYGIARFVCGAGLSGFMGMSTVYPIEFLMPKWRFLIGSIGPWGEGVMILAGLGYFFTEWRHLLFVSSLPFLFVVIIYPFLPESPRWLLLKGRKKEAKEVLSQMASVNGRRLSPNLLEGLELEEEKTKSSYKEFFIQGELRRKSLILMGIWFSWSLAYFGVSYNMKNMRGNPNFNLGIMGLSDAVGYPLALILNNKIGRRKSLIFFMGAGGFFLFVLGALDMIFGVVSLWTAGVLCFVGKVGVAGARSCARTLTSESFPTRVRTMGYGISGITAGVAGILAPQIAFFGSQWWHPLPFVSFGIVGVLGSLVSLLLPETAGRELEEGESRALNNKRAPIYASL